MLKSFFVLMMIISFLSLDAMKQSCRMPSPSHFLLTALIKKEAATLEDLAEFVPNSRYENNNTLLHKAVELGDLEMISIVYSMANQLITVLNDDGKTPVDLARASKNTLILEKLGFQK